MTDLLIVGNWKMNGSKAANAALLSQLSALAIPKNKTVGICAPYIYLAQLDQALAESDISVGAQDVSVHSAGAYTGEISAAMLKEFGCQFVIVGHSERRQYHHETDALVAQKAKAVITAGLTPIICVGETLDQRDSGDTLAIIASQCDAITEVIGKEELNRTVIAYEPIWAIGTGLTATPEQAQEVHQFIRRHMKLPETFKILYGGSVNGSNAKALFAQDDINGGLIGGASLKFEEFSLIINA